MQIIGISGKAGSGKDWLGREVLRPLGFKQFSLAWPMKCEGVGVGFSYEDMFYDKPDEARDWLQQRGTEEGWMKHGEDLWLRTADAWLRTLREGGWEVDKVYVPDVRFPHEVRWLRRQGAKLVRVEHGAGRVYPLLWTEAATHSSEVALDCDCIRWDAVIRNAAHTTPGEVREKLEAAGVLVPSSGDRGGSGQLELGL